MRQEWKLFSLVMFMIGGSLLISSATTVQGGGGHGEGFFKLYVCNEVAHTIEVSGGNDIRHVNLGSPRDITVGPDNLLYVANWGFDNVIRFDPETDTFVDVFVPAGRGDLEEPSAIAWSNSVCYVWDDWNRKIRCYDLGGNFIGNSSGGNPHGVTQMSFNPIDGKLYVTSKVTNEVLIYNQNGVFQGVCIPADDPDANMPNGVTFTPGGDMLVAMHEEGGMIVRSIGADCFIDAVVVQEDFNDLNRQFRNITTGPDIDGDGVAEVFVVATGQGGGNRGVLQYDGASFTFITLFEPVSHGRGLTFYETENTGIGPTATTLSATDVGTTSALLQGEVNPNGSTTSYWFEWGPSPSMSNNTPTRLAGSGTSPIQVDEPLANLTPDTFYYFRVVAENTSGRKEGNTFTFTTLVGGGEEEEEVLLAIIPSDDQISTGEPLLVTGSAQNFGPTVTVHAFIWLQYESEAPTEIRRVLNKVVPAGANVSRVIFSGIGGAGHITREGNYDMIVSIINTSDGRLLANTVAKFTRVP